MAIVAVIVFRNVASFGHTWFKLHIIHGLRGTVASRLLGAYLAHPYTYFLRTNSAELTKNLTQEVDQFVTSYLHGWVTMVADIAMTLAIIGLMVAVSPVASGIVLGLLGAAAGAMWLLSRARVGQLGRINRELNEKRLRAVSEAVGAIKDVKLLARESYFVDRLSRIYADIRRNTVAFNLITEAPRSVLEIASVSAILAMFLIVHGETGSMAETAGIVSTIVVALYRLMPVVHRILSGGSALRFSAAVRDAFARAMIEGHARMPRAAHAAVSFSFDRSIRAEGLAFRHDGAPNLVLDGVDLEVELNAVVGIVGPSGAGKTTLVEVILGLLEPTAGRVMVDGRAIDSANVTAWQRMVAYVPQSIYMSDDTILRNVAFGVPDNEIDHDLAAEAMRIAHLDGFVSSLPKGAHTMTGERGVRLSGGQRQRIGIARALYGRARLLVLDEATSALDGITEAVIEDAIAGLAGKVTVVIIAHRLSTVRRCDTIHLMDRGRIVASGTYDDLIARNETFRAMARTA
jgi:ABC-type multidrug transport system fused ATPase/permease subunit